LRRRREGEGEGGEEIAMQPQAATAAADQRARGGEGWRGAESPRVAQVDDAGSAAVATDKLEVERTEEAWRCRQVTPLDL
jgi:hypothetical protein